MYKYIYTYTCIYTFRSFTYIQYIPIYVYTYVYICLYIYTYTHMFICIYISTHTFSSMPVLQVPSSAEWSHHKSQIHIEHRLFGMSGDSLPPATPMSAASAAEQANLINHPKDTWRRQVTTNVSATNVSTTNVSTTNVSTTNVSITHHATTSNNSNVALSQNSLQNNRMDNHAAPNHTTRRPNRDTKSFLDAFVQSPAATPYDNYATGSNMRPQMPKQDVNSTPPDSSTCDVSSCTRATILEGFFLSHEQCSRSLFPPSPPIACSLILSIVLSQTHYLRLKHTHIHNNITPHHAHTYTRTCLFLENQLHYSYMF